MLSYQIAQLVTLTYIVYINFALNGRVKKPDKHSNPIRKTSLYSLQNITKNIGQVQDPPYCLTYDVRISEHPSMLYTTFQLKPLTHQLPLQLSHSTPMDHNREPLPKGG